MTAPGYPAGAVVHYSITKKHNIIIGCSGATPKSKSFFSFLSLIQITVIGNPCRAVWEGGASFALTILVGGLVRFGSKAGSSLTRVPQRVWLCSRHNPTFLQPWGDWFTFIYRRTDTPRGRKSSEEVGKSYTTLVGLGVSPWLPLPYILIIPHLTLFVKRFLEIF